MAAFDGRHDGSKHTIELDHAHRLGQGFLSLIEQAVELLLRRVAIDAAVPFFQGLAGDPKVGAQFLWLDPFVHRVGRLRRESLFLGRDQ